jgi:hypothetical protein
MAMKAYLQCIETGRFLKDPETWIIEREHALEFESAASAIEFWSVQRIRIRNRIRIILIFDGNPGTDISLPAELNRAVFPPHDRKERSGMNHRAE